MTRDEIQQEILSGLSPPIHGLLTLAPRVGKTKMAISIIKNEKPKSILYVTPSTELRDKDIPNEFIKWKAKSYLNKTTIICYASLAQHKGNYDKIILDEYQFLTPVNSLPFFNNQITYNTIIGLSGTDPKHFEKKELYRKLNLLILSKMSIDEAVEANLIAPYNIEVIFCELNSKNKNVKGGSKTKSFMQTEESMYNYLTKRIAKKIVNNETVPKAFYFSRMRFIYNLKSKNDFAKKFINKLKGRTLVFTGGIEQAENMLKHTYHSQTDNKDLLLFQEGKVNSLACVNSGGIGFTYEGVDNFVIVQINSDNRGDVTQKIARALVLQENYTAKIYIIVVKDTVDEIWLEKVLLNFNRSKVTFKNYRNYE